MIDSVDKIEYSKEKTLTCNGGNEHSEQDELLLKYKKTLDMNTTENGIICDGTNKLEQLNVNKISNSLKKSIYTESGNKDSSYFQNIKEISKKNENNNYKEVNNIYNKNIIGTKYYDQSIKDSISDKSSKETICPLECDNNHNSANVINYQNSDQKNEIKNMEKNKSFDYCNDIYKSDKTNKEIKNYETNHEKLVYLEKNNLISNNCNDIEYVNDTTVDYISLKNLSQYSINESSFKENNSNDINNYKKFDHIINVNDSNDVCDNNKSNTYSDSKNVGHHGETDKLHSNQINSNTYVIDENDFHNNKNLHINKEMNISKKKNDTTLKKSGIYEYKKYEKNKGVEGYYHNDNSEISLRNVKCENSTSAYNEIINNNRNPHYMVPPSQVVCNKSNNNKKKDNMIYYESRRNIDKMGGRPTDMNSRMVVKINENIESKEVNENMVAYKDMHRSNRNSINCRDTKIENYCNNINQNYHNNCNSSYYNPITENDIIHNEMDYNNSQGKRYYLAPPKKNDGTKYSKNQMLMISKQKIKKMWNKFKHGSSKDQTVGSTVDDENSMFPNGIENSGNIQQKVQIYNDYYELNNIHHNNGYKDCINKPIKWVKNNNNIEKPIQSKCIFNWKIAQMSLLKLLHSAHNFHFNNVKYSDWKFVCIPTLGFSKSSNRVQQMYKAIVPSKDGNSKNDMKLFIKKIPIYIWVKQFNLMTEYDGEYVTDGENFVMEAASLAFLSEYHPRIAPKLHKILYEVDSNNLDNLSNLIPSESMFGNLTVFNSVLAERLKNNINGNIVLVSEFFSEDILDFIDRRQKNFNMKISNNEKSYILYQCLKLLIRLHDAGLSHLDLTPENILISDNYEMRLCDLSKSTPIYTYNLRHIKDANRLYLFESCEPTIAKGAYMPPECWKIYWKYDTMKIKNPLKDLKSITDQEKRKQFYFDVANADKFMLGVFFFWIWTNGNLWKCSDPLQDEDFFYFVKCDMNFDKFELTRKWPSELKSIIKGLLHAETRKKLNLKDMIMHPWWSCKL
ncbi:serine/threonine protein kinase, FIKK family [Plasmodium chabaudi chabaudi]|uniref:Serine/threonine protein kinase, FIKK family n=1 Tax=Plasmodium chabaudi chabaudi TaxID=31271 RepID=A0A4V0K9K5_PLACU|nr:serine/threonine protein kinase, FIKK family [Plasmodium chabaudi chabaudi]VTZ69728.1 serine/threonine protein kinase, FIKK family [Plasmodium chabaudi chabaudi]|eukprot:XP_016654277.1 serine/threonine protein kinase, FIKK family [Plasmodium chabaudi chabaudi]